MNKLFIAAVVIVVGVGTSLNVWKDYSLLYGLTVNSVTSTET